MQENKSNLIIIQTVIISILGTSLIIGAAIFLWNYNSAENTLEESQETEITEAVETIQDEEAIEPKSVADNTSNTSLSTKKLLPIPKSNLKPQLKHVININSEKYALKIPVLEGFEFENQFPNYEFSLRSTIYPDIKFYIASDYSPGGSDDDEYFDYSLKADSGEIFNVTKILNGYNRNSYIYYIEAASDNEFYFSATQKAENDSIKNEIIDQIIRGIWFTKL